MRRYNDTGVVVVNTDALIRVTPPAAGGRVV